MKLALFRKRSLSIGGCRVKSPKLLTSFFLFAVLIAAIEPLAAQQPADPPPAPIPSPIFAAKSVFISNATGEVFLPHGNPDLTYNSFYEAMKSWGRYQLVSSPSDADLIFEIRFTFANGPNTFRDPQFPWWYWIPRLVWPFGPLANASRTTKTRERSANLSTTLWQPLWATSKSWPLHAPANPGEARRPAQM
jgi:hypothetical protein